MLTTYQINRIARRVVHRSLLAAGRPIPIGKTFENSSLRVHRFRPSVRVWDLTNAGRRGKRVDIFAVYDLDYLDDAGVALVDAFTASLRRSNFAKASQAAEKLLVDLAALPKGSMAKITRSQEKGVRIDPPGMGPVEVRGRSVAVRIEPQSFWIRDLTDLNNEPTLIPRNRRATSTKKLYAWAVANKSKIKGMTFRQVQDVMSDLGVDAHYYLAMD